MSKRLVRLRRLAFERQDGRCFYCGAAMWLGSSIGPSRLRCTAENLVPRSEGGSETSDNIVAACVHCNRTRHKRKQPPPSHVYRDEVTRRVRRGAWHPAWVHRSGYLGPALSPSA